ncbi:malonate decarboxylase subunit alpha (plasmid) [Thioclava sp. 'Guangxiensis']|uniref:malonate decarboxylase subunit alpha n=1 Tax=Thioclava sp. 'Guangxiensis' TaxID=3149044 RepID=UPI0032C428E4
MRILTPDEAVLLIEDGWRVISGGFGCCGHPDSLTQALRRRFQETGHPRDLRLFFASGGGDKRGAGLDALALPGLIKEAVGGFWGFCPSLTAMACSGEISAHNWPQGVVSKMFSAIGAGEREMSSPIGLGTFIDPRLEGGVVSPHTSPLIELRGEGRDEALVYPALTPNCCLLRATAADARGNISMKRETSYMDALAQAIAVRNSGGIVIVQVEEIVARHDSLPEIQIPGMLVDYVVKTDEAHPASYGVPSDPRFISPGSCNGEGRGAEMSGAKSIIVERALEELQRFRGEHVNFGIGVPALIGAAARRRGIDNIWATIESGVVGGVPEEGLAFGASVHPDAIISQPALFDFYHGGGIAAAFLGFGEIDFYGNVNVSRFGDRMPGAGGFINISQSARAVIFCGTFTAKGLDVDRLDGRVIIRREGGVRKLVPNVTQRTFSAERARQLGQEVLYITERAVFRLGIDGLELIECYPGIEIGSVLSATGAKSAFAYASPLN